MGKKKWYPILIICIVLMLVMNKGVLVLAASASGTTITLSKTEGSDIVVKSGSGKELTKRTGMTLYDGYQVNTGKKSYAYLMLDKTKAVKLDENTKVGIEKEGRKNEINLNSGNIFFNVNKKLTKEESVKVKTSNNTMGIRGTSGVVIAKEYRNEKGEYQGRRYEVQIYDGEGYIELREINSKKITYYTIKPGQRLIVSEVQSGKLVATKETLKLDEMPASALSEILNDEELLARVMAGLKVDKKALEEALHKNEQAQTALSEAIYQESIRSKEEIDNKKAVIYDTTPDNEQTIGNTTGDTTGNASENTSEEQKSEPTTKQLDPHVEDGIGLFSVDEIATALAGNDTYVVLNTSDLAEEYRFEGEDKELTIPAGKTLVIPDGMTISSEATVTNNGTFENNGTESFHNFGIYVNSGTIVNNGKIVNEPGSTFINSANGVIKINASGSLYNSEINMYMDMDMPRGASFTNKGVITVEDGGILKNGSMNQSEDTANMRAEQYACFVNEGTINGTISNTHVGYIVNKNTGKIGTLNKENGYLLNWATDLAITNLIGEDSNLQRPYFITVCSSQNPDLYILSRESSLEYIGIPNNGTADYTVWDTDMFAVQTNERLRENTLVITENNEAEAVLFGEGCNAGYDYYYGCTLRDALSSMCGGSDGVNECGYNSLTLKKNLILADEIGIDEMLNFNLKERNYEVYNSRKFSIFLNGYVLDFTGREESWNDSQDQLELLVYGNADASQADGIPSENQIIMGKSTNELVMHNIAFYNVGIDLKGRLDLTTIASFSNCRLDINGGTMELCSPDTLMDTGIPVYFYKTIQLNVNTNVTQQEASDVGIVIEEGRSINFELDTEEQSTFKTCVGYGIGIRVNNGGSLILGSEDSPSQSFTIEVTTSDNTTGFYVDGRGVLSAAAEIVPIGTGKAYLFVD